MKIIEFVKLYEHLTHEENLRPWEAIRNIAKLRKVAPEILMAIREWSYGFIPEIAIKGVSYAELTEKEGLKPVQAFLMLDWLKRDPVAAMRFMEIERFSSPIMPLSEEEKQIVHDAINKLKDEGVMITEEKVAENLDELSDEEKTDIELSEKQP